MAIIQLLRITTLPILWSNVLAAYLIGRGNNFVLLLFLLVSMSSIYLGGKALHDYSDANTDAFEQPDRPISSGKISLNTTFILGMCLVTFGVFVGFICPFIGDCSSYEKRIAIGLVTVLFLFVISYNAFLKRMSIIGPFTMGVCRVLCYLFVFFTVEPVVLVSHVILSIFVGAYVMCWTMISMFEMSSQKIQKWVEPAFLFLILIDSVACFFFVGIIPALFVIPLFPVAFLLRRFVSEVTES
ncbi:MAG: UbiA family prenyltransferase [Planctomycetaceae bacterium]|jgi:4-hydroxybenzoate polyprenyltransferase|nr:UbiA family prenyltransferase [Planctomycetaceae bacterium]